MANMETESQAVLVPAQITWGSRNPFINLNSTEDRCHLPTNSYQTTTEATVTSTAEVDPNTFSNDLDSGMEWELSPKLVMRTVYGHTQDFQEKRNSIQQRYGALGSTLSDHHSLVAHEQLESQSDFFPSQMVELPSGAKPTPGSQYLDMNESGRNYAQHGSGFNAINFEDAMQGSSDLSNSRGHAQNYWDLDPHFPMNHNDGLEPEALALEGLPPYNPPWSTMFRHETERPQVAVTPDVAIFPPSHWHMENLVAIIPCTGQSWSRGLCVDTLIESSR